MPLRVCLPMGRILIDFGLGFLRKAKFGLAAKSNSAAIRTEGRNCLVVTFVRFEDCV